MEIRTRGEVAMHPTRSSADALDREISEIGRGEFEIQMFGLDGLEPARLGATLPYLKNGWHVERLSPEQEGVIRHDLLAKQVEGAVEAIFDRRISDAPWHDQFNDA